MTKEEKAIEILMEKNVFYWCDYCDEWIEGDTSTIKEHLRDKHF